jgi:Transposase
MERVRDLHPAAWSDHEVVVHLTVRSNALIESTNTKLRVLHRMAFGFRQPEHLVALALLDRGGYCPPLPGRDHASATALATLD